jgi:hypothetical protein
VPLCVVQLAPSAERLLDLPTRVPATLEIALWGERPAPCSRLTGAGWVLRVLVHSTAAHALAREVFHYGVVLRRLLERALPSRMPAAA